MYIEYSQEEKDRRDNVFWEIAAKKDLKLGERIMFCAECGWDEMPPNAVGPSKCPQCSEPLAVFSVDENDVDFIRRIKERAASAARGERYYAEFTSPINWKLSS